MQPLPPGPDEAIKPQIILCLGGPAAKTIIDKDFKITKDRGKWYEVDGIKAMATFHPAYVLRQRGDDLQARNVRCGKMSRRYTLSIRKLWKSEFNS
jgi:uracil-DNA glycosylase family 4